MRTPLRAGLALLALACTEAGPRDLGGGGETAGGPPQPQFVPYPPSGAAAAPPNASGAGGTATYPTGAAATTGQAGTQGSDGAAGGPSGPSGPWTFIPDFTPVAMGRAGVTVAGTRERADGTTRAMRWTADLGAEELPMLDATSDATLATGISGDGVVIVGAETPHHLDTPFAVQWFPGALPERLGLARSTDEHSWARAISANRVAVACNSGKGPAPHPDDRAPDERAYQWSNHGTEVIEPLPGDTGTQAILISDDGETIAGYSFGGPSPHDRVFVWSLAAGGTVEVTVPLLDAQLVPRFLSEDGSVLVVEVIGGPPAQPIRRVFRWARGGGAFVMPQTTRGNTRADGFSATGGIVLGTDYDLAGGDERQPVPFLSTPTAGTPLPIAGLFDSIWSAVMDPGARVIAGIGSTGAGPKTLALWTNSGRTVPALDPFPLPFTGLLVLDSRLIAISTNRAVLLGAGKNALGEPIAWTLSLPPGF